MPGVVHHHIKPPVLSIDTFNCLIGGRRGLHVEFNCVQFHFVTAGEGIQFMNRGGIATSEIAMPA